MIGPGSDNDGTLDEVPFKIPKSNLTAPSASPVVYKSRPISRVSECEEEVISLTKCMLKPRNDPSKPFPVSGGFILDFPKSRGEFLLRGRLVHHLRPPQEIGRQVFL